MYEYQIIFDHEPRLTEFSELTDKINEAARLGWEVVGYAHEDGTASAMMRRQVKDVGNG